MNGRRVCGGAAVTTAVYRGALLGIVFVLVVIAYFPFVWSPPRNQVTRSAEGSLRFGHLNYARTSGTPAWLNDVRTSGRIQIQLEASPQSLRQDASMMMLASDDWDTDFAIGQDYSDLVVWLRRTGSDPNGDPPFVIRGVLQPRRWTSVDVILLRGDLQIDVNGRTRLTEHLPADSLQTWGQGKIALGDEVLGGGPWQGQIRLAQVRSPGYAVDYVRPGALSVPVNYLYLDHIEPFPPRGLKSWLTVFFHMLSFIPVGFLIVFARRPPVRPVPATLLAAALAVVLAAGKFLFYGRHAAVADIVAESAGGLLGAVLAWKKSSASNWTQRLRRSAPGG